MSTLFFCLPTHFDQNPYCSLRGTVSCILISYRLDLNLLASRILYDKRYNVIDIVSSNCS